MHCILNRINAGHKGADSVKAKAAITGVGVADGAQAEVRLHPRGQVLPFAPTPINLPKWHALFALNSPARFTT